MLNMKANTAVMPQLSSDQKRFIRLCHDPRAASGHNIYFSRSFFMFSLFIFNFPLHPEFHSMIHSYIYLKH